MLNLSVTADNYEELKDKVFLALGLKAPAQGALNFATATVTEIAEVAPEKMVAKAPAPKKEVKTKAAPKPKVVAPVIEEVEPIEDSADEDLLDEEVIEGPATKDICMSTMRMVLSEKGMEVGSRLLAKFGLKKFAEIKDDQLEEFYAAAKAALK